MYEQGGDPKTEAGGADCSGDCFAGGVLPPDGSPLGEESERSPTIPCDAVDHPQHYNSHPSGIEVIEITEHMGFCLGNAVKYILRCDLKGKPIEDLKKAVWYINREISLRERKDVKSRLDDLAHEVWEKAIGPQPVCSQEEWDERVERAQQTMREIRSSGTAAEARRNCIPVPVEEEPDHSASLAGLCLPDFSLPTLGDMGFRVPTCPLSEEIGVASTPDLDLPKPKRTRRTKAQMEAARAQKTAEARACHTAIDKRLEEQVPDTVRPPVSGANVEEELGIPEALIGDGMRTQLIERAIAGFVVLRSEVTDVTNGWELLVSRAPAGWFATQMENLDL